MKPADPVIDVTRDPHGKILYPWPGREAISSSELTDKELLMRLNKAIQADGHLRHHDFDAVGFNPPMAEYNREHCLKRKGVNLLIADLGKEAMIRGLIDPYDGGQNERDGRRTKISGEDNR